MGRNSIFTAASLERVARIYKDNTAAAAALGITGSAFARLCKKHGIESPAARRQRERREASRSFV